MSTNPGTQWWSPSSRWLPHTHSYSHPFLSACGIVTKLTSSSPWMATPWIYLFKLLCRSQCPAFEVLLHGKQTNKQKNCKITWIIEKVQGFFYFYFSFGGWCWDWIQDLVYSRQAVYQLNYNPRPPKVWDLYIDSCPFWKQMQSTEMLSTLVLLIKLF